RRVIKPCVGAALCAGGASRRAAGGATRAARLPGGPLAAGEGLAGTLERRRIGRAVPALLVAGPDRAAADHAGSRARRQDGAVRGLASAGPHSRPPRAPTDAGALEDAVARVGAAAAAARAPAAAAGASPAAAAGAGVAVSRRTAAALGRSAEKHAH